MNDTTLNNNRRLLLAGVFLTSLSALALEITFARILSALLAYHYAFIVISMALLGLGLGGIIAYFIRRRGASSFESLVSGLYALSIPVSILLVTSIRFSTNLLAFTAVIVIPFIFAGVFLAQAFQSLSHQSNRVYFADLMGAGAGSLLVVVILNKLGAINTGFLLGLVAATGCVLLALSIKRQKWFSFASVVTTAAIFFTSVSFPNLVDIPMGINPDKELSAALDPQILSSSRIKESRWTSFGRTDLVQYADNPGYMGLFLDGTAGTIMYEFNGDIANPGPAIEELKTTFPGYFPFPLLQPDQKDNALIIGAGGGRDVLVALMGGVRQITAVDVNRDLVEIVKKYSSYNGGIYTSLPNVKVVVAEGRSYLDQQDERYDIIMMSLAVTNTSRSPEGFALTENYLFTKESIQAYLDHLTPEGRLLVVAHQSLEVAKLIALSTAVLEERGIDSKTAMDYVYTVGSHARSLFVLSKSRVSREESYRSHEALHRLSYMADNSYFPYITLGTNPDHLKQNIYSECQMLNPAFTALSLGRLTQANFDKILATQGYDIGLVTDNRPFFYKLETGIPQALVVPLWLSLVFVLLAVVAPYAYRRGVREKSRHRGPGKARFILLFLSLGMGFMLVEIALIQKLTLFLGEPVLSISVLLFSLLVGTGLGGLYSGKFVSGNPARKIMTAALVIAFVLPVYAFGAPLVLGQLIGQIPVIRAAVAAVLLLPLGFFMGLPFPLGVKLARRVGLESYIPWLWGINGTASVLGSVVAVVAGMSAGFTQVMLMGAAFYLFISTIFFLGREYKTVDTQDGPHAAGQKVAVVRTMAK